MLYYGVGTRTYKCDKRFQFCNEEYFFFVLARLILSIYCYYYYYDNWTAQYKMFLCNIRGHLIKWLKIYCSGDQYLNFMRYKYQWSIDWLLEVLKALIEITEFIKSVALMALLFDSWLKAMTWIHFKNSIHTDLVLSF